jgi:hypothetical protein
MFLLEGGRFLDIKPPERLALDRFIANLVVGGAWPF